jgi:hypothetical protein
VRCLCTACLLEAALKLLNTGRVGMGILLIEQALQRERERVEHQRPVKAPARVRKPRARA